jgi:hypothetical protein
MRRRTAGGTPLGRPITRNLTLRAMSSGSSRSMDRSRRLMSVETSWLGRFQFSDENA